ncbi:hypothetical protein R1sor_018782 [Riccia sorocarpa]|uniref:Uncharacterized protein n=1 Tax=Riccia sorocarpa TaxID=122646 RepID=A0ABD3IEE7_9MARC
MAARGKVVELEAKVAEQTDQLKRTAEALEAERRRNFADGSLRAAWDLERHDLQRRIDLLSRERDHGADLKMVVMRWQQGYVACMTCERSGIALTMRTTCARSCASSRDGLLYQFIAEKLIDGAAARNRQNFYEAGREPFGWEVDEKRRHDLIVPFLKRAIVAYQLLYEHRQPLHRRLECRKTYLQRAHRDFADNRLEGADVGPEYHLRHRVIELLYFYLCPSRASPGTFAKYGDELHPLISRNWPPECFNYNGVFLPQLRHLEGGTALLIACTSTC